MLLALFDTQKDKDKAEKEMLTLEQDLNSAVRKAINYYYAFNKPSAPTDSILHLLQQITPTHF